jgi:L-malate glycosyltransferase
MKIAFLSANKGLAWGGSEELWAAAARRALDTGHAVALCTFAWKEPAPQVLALRDRGATLIPIPLSPPKLSLFGPKYPWLRDLADFQPTVVCISQGQEYDLAGRRWGPAVIDWLRQSGTPAASVVQYNDDVSHPRGRASKPAREFVQLVRLNAYVAQRNLEQTERALRMPVPHAAILRNPVNLTDISPLPWPTAAGPARFACVARLHAATKGHDLLLAALARPQWKDRDWTLSLFGTGPDEHCFREMASAMLGDNAPRVEFRGFTSDIRSIWAEHHALVLGSRGEGTPLALVEAMLLGRPAIVTDVGDCAEWIREGHEGFVAPNPTADALSDALDRAWSARSQWPHLGAAAATRAHQLFDPDAGDTLLRKLIEIAR